MTPVRAVASPVGPATGPNRALARLRQACGEFEGFLLAQMMQVMRQNCLESDFMSGGLAEEVFTDQALMALGAQLGERSGLGIARLLYEQMAPAMSGAGAAGAEHVLDAGPSERVSPPTAARPPARRQPMAEVGGC